MTGYFPMYNKHNNFSYLRNYINQSPPMSDSLLFPIEKDEICGSLVKFASSPQISSTEKRSQEDIGAVWNDFAQNGHTRDYEEMVDIDAISGYLLKLIDTKKLQFLPSTQHLARKIRHVNRMHEKGQTRLPECVFCKNNNESIGLIRNHVVRDASGKVTCPILRSFKCPICGGTGDDAHTVKYCPMKPIITMQDTELVECARMFHERYACK